MAQARQDNNDNMEMVPPLPPRLDFFASQTRRVYISGPILPYNASQIIPTLQLLSITDDPVYIYINSPGGDVASGYAIIDQILLMKNVINTIVIGEAFSMSAMLCAYGTKGYRFGTKNSTFMLHDISYAPSPDYIGHQHRGVDFVAKTAKERYRDLAKRLNVTLDELKTLSSQSHWMSCKNAIKVGLIDGLWTPDKEQAINSAYAKHVVLQNFNGEGNE